MIRLVLTHKKETNYQTLGLMEVYKDSLFMFCFATLELAWKDNKKNISRVWNGTWIVEHFSSKKHPNVFILKNTEPRTGILIHIVNYVKDLAGCIGIGLTHGDINGDGYYDLVHSTESMNKLRNLCKDEEYILLTIK